MSQWQDISSAPKDGTHVDLWMEWYASPLTMGLSDAFRVPDAWYEDGKWVHRFRGKVEVLNDYYIRFWMPLPPPPISQGKGDSVDLDMEAKRC